MEDLKYLDTFVVHGFEIPAWGEVCDKFENIEFEFDTALSEEETLSQLNPIERFLYINESADREDAISQRKNLKDIVEYIVKKY